MKRYITLSAILVLASVLMAPMASAQCPLSTLSGTWAFHITDISFQPLAWQDIFVLGSAGQFTVTGATRDNGIVGVLSTIDTTSKNLGIFRQEVGGGSYTLLPGCNGGTITFTNTNSGLGSYDFYWAGASQLYLIGIDAGTLKGGVASQVP